MNRGKDFEGNFRKQMDSAGFDVNRVADNTAGYMGGRYICDFITYLYPNIFYFECKTIKGNTFPLTNLKQYDKLLAKKNIKGVIAGVVLWFYEHDKVLFIPIKTFEKLKENNQKSFNIKMIGGGEYPSIVIPSIKKRTFMDSDYTVLLSMEEDK